MDYSKACEWFEICPIRFFCEAGKLDKKWIKEYCLGDNSKCARKKLEDNGVPHPDNMLPDGTIDASLE